VFQVTQAHPVSHVTHAVPEAAALDVSVLLCTSYGCSTCSVHTQYLRQMYAQFSPYLAAISYGGLSFQPEVTSHRDVLCGLNTDLSRHRWWLGVARVAICYMVCMWWKKETVPAAT
jgi:hypothetical protein